MSTEGAAMYEDTMTDGAGASYNPEQEDTRQVQQQVSRLRDEVARLGEVVTKLDKRLASVTTDAAPEAEKSSLAEVQPARVPLAENLFEQNVILATHIERIIRILGRVEL